MRGLFVSQLGCRVRLFRMIERVPGVLPARFMSPFAAMLRRRAMTLGGVLMFLRSCVVGFNYVVVFVHRGTPFPGLTVQSAQRLEKMHACGRAWKDAGAERGPFRSYLVKAPGTRRERRCPGAGCTPGTSRRGPDLRRSRSDRRSNSSR